MRIDQRLESQRLLMESVRHKLIRGVVGDDSDGYHGIQNALHRLDVAGDGYLDANVFMKKFVQRLKCPLTRPERELLLEQLRAQSTGKAEDVLDYEQVIRVHFPTQTLTFQLIGGLAVPVRTYLQLE